MSDELGFGLDRRDFMMATIASVGASAVLAANTSAANAQGIAVPGAAGSAQVAPQGTVYTGDVIQGKKVISALDVNDLEPGRHFFYFQGVQMPTCQHWYVSVIVVKGQSQASASPSSAGCMATRSVPCTPYRPS